MLTRLATLTVLAAWAFTGCGGGATPAPPPTATDGPALRALDGVYAAEITRADLRRMRLSRTAPVGVWKIAIKAYEREVEVSAPEGPRSGSYTLAIQRVERGRLTLGPDRTCVTAVGRARGADVAYSLQRSTLVFIHAHGGCPSAWVLLRATRWHQA